MFVRFRVTRRRLQVSLVETRRDGGKVRHEHIAGLGSLPVQPSIADRIEFWAQLPQIFGRLANRLNADDQCKAFTVVHERIPMPTLDKRRTLQIENAEADERFWSGLEATQEDFSAGHKVVAALSELKADEAKNEADKAARKSCRAARSHFSFEKRRGCCWRSGQTDFDERGNRDHGRQGRSTAG
jgi:hypothetical protein